LFLGDSNKEIRKKAKELLEYLFVIMNEKFQVLEKNLNSPNLNINKGNLYKLFIPENYIGLMVNVDLTYR